MPGAINPDPDAQPFSLESPANCVSVGHRFVAAHGVALAPVGVGPTEQFGKSTLTLFVTPSGIGPSELLGQPIVVAHPLCNHRPRLGPPPPRRRRVFTTSFRPDIRG